MEDVDDVDPENLDSEKVISSDLVTSNDSTITIRVTSSMSNESSDTIIYYSDTTCTTVMSETLDQDPSKDGIQLILQSDGEYGYSARYENSLAQSDCGVIDKVYRYDSEVPVEVNSSRSIIEHRS